MTPLVCTGRVSVSFVDMDGEDAGFDLPCNSPLTVHPDKGLAVCPNGHQWPAKEPVDG